ncbi:unnamed protein product [Orchesella dallaii]|uniref:Uncharacterized protein n=1 Tax=Orchesella dallaii TaxID=48710 RepID=A0ABP1QUC0_9HEXA
MSKTAILAFTRYGKKEDTEPNHSHHLINVPIQSHTSDKNRHKTAKQEDRSLTRTTGYRLGEGQAPLEMSRRSSIVRNNKNPIEISRSNNQKDGVKKGNLSDSKRSSTEHRQASNNQQQQLGRENGQLSNPTNEKKSLESYFQDRGVNLHKVKKNCKIYNKEEWEGGQPRRGGLYLSTFSPPSGFSREDVPESQGMSQPLEEPISPAVRIADQLQKEREIRRIRKASEGDDCSDVIRRLKETRRHNQNQITEAVLESQVKEELNATFPEDDSFSDSFLIRCSQQVEGVACESNKEWLHNEENINGDGRIKRDVNGRKVTESTSKSLPLTSTPISDSNFGIQKLPTNETPKSRVMGLSRTRNRSAGQSNSSLFECSSENLEIKYTEETEEAPRKLLKFDESPIKIGDFNDDEDDEIFSQMELPVADTRSLNSKCC